MPSPPGLAPPRALFPRYWRVLLLGSLALALVIFWALGGLPPRLVQVLPLQAELIWRFPSAAQLADFPGRALWYQLPRGASEPWLVQASLGPQARGFLLAWRGAAWVGPDPALGAVALPPTRLRGRVLRHWRDRQGQTWSYTSFRGIRLLATAPWLVEEALRQARTRHRADWHRQLARLPASRTGVLQRVGLGASWRWQWLQPEETGGWTAIALRQDLPTAPPSPNEPLWTALAPNFPLDLVALEPLLGASTRSGAASKQWQTHFQPWLGGTPLLATRSIGGSTARVLVLPWRDATAAARALSALAATQGRLEQYQYQSFGVERVLSVDLGAVFPGYGLEKWQNAYLTQGAGAVWLSASRHALERWIDAFVVGATYGQQPPPGWTAGSALRCLLTPRYASLAPLPAALAPWGLAATSWRGEGTLRHRRWEARLHPLGRAANRADLALLWQLILPDGVSPRRLWPVPAWGGLLVQDAQQRLHLVDTIGTLRWSRTLEGPWLGPPCLVDYYGDGSPQYLGNTANAIHCLDASGRDLPGFPRPLQNPAANALVTSGLRADFFLAARNGSLYGYDRQGRPLAGWNPGPNVGPVDWPLHFGQLGGRDYLFVLNRAGVLSTWDYSAQRHFSDQTMLLPLTSAPQLQWLPQTPRWVVGQADGTLRVVNPQGESFGLSLALGAGGPRPLVLVAPLRGDARLDAAAVRDRQLVVHQYSGNRWLLAYRLTLPQAPDSLFALPSGKRTYLGLRYGPQGPLELVDERGKRLPGAPLPGVAAVSLDSQRLVVVLQGQQVVAYRLP